MQTAAVFRIILAILFIVVIATRKVFEQQSATLAAQGVKRDQDAGRAIVLQSALLTISNLAIIVYLINPRWMAWSSFSLPNWLAWVGVLLGAAGAGLLLWSHRALGVNFFGGVKLRKGHQLVTAGPYRWARHPMYTAFLLLGLAWTLLAGNWLIGGCWLAASLLVMATRVGEEERMMLKEFGKEYEAYRQGTSRYFPGF